MWREAEDRLRRRRHPSAPLLQRQYRLGAGLTQDALAERAGLSVRAIQNLERGERRPYADTDRPPGGGARSRRAGAGGLRAVPPGRPPRRRPVLLHGREPHPPPAPSLPPTNLPAALTACIGREAERAAVLKLLRTGAPGDAHRPRRLRARRASPSRWGQTWPAIAGRGERGGESAARARRTAGRRGPPDQGRRPLPGKRVPGAGSGSPPEDESGSALDGWPFPDGVWLVELGPLADPALVPEAVAEVLEVPEEPGRALLSTLSEALRAAAPALVVGQLRASAGRLRRAGAGRARGSLTCGLLATSREGSLGIYGEQRPYRFLSLSVPDPPKQSPAPGPSPKEKFEAVRLFVDRAFQNSSPNSPDRDETRRPSPGSVVRLDGIPLAIELAAARKGEGAPGRSQIAARLDDRFRLLTGGSRTALPRHQTLRATLDWSYDLLSSPERTLFPRLSVFAGGWTWRPPRRSAPI